jgi:hypothetical protein
MSLAPVAKQQFFGNDGNVLSGGFLYTYEAGNPTPLATYSESTLTIPNSNPIVLDSAGRAPAIYLSPVSYKFVLKTALFVTVWTQDNILNSEDLILSNLASTSTGLGDALIGYKGPGTGAQGRTLHDRMADFSVSAFDYMTAAQIADVKAGTALVDVTAAVLAADTAAGTTGTLYIPKGTYLIDDLTLVSHVVCDGVFSINTGHTLTINGPFDAGLYQVFSGAGTAVFGASSVSRVHPEWIGVVMNSNAAAIQTTNCSLMNKLLASTASSEWALPSGSTTGTPIEVAPGVLYIDAPITLKTGNKIIGSGAELTRIKNTTAGSVFEIPVAGARYWTIRDIWLETLGTDTTGHGVGTNAGTMTSGPINYAMIDVNFTGGGYAFYQNYGTGANTVGGYGGTLERIKVFNGMGVCYVVNVNVFNVIDSGIDIDIRTQSPAAFYFESKGTGYAGGVKLLNTIVEGSWLNGTGAGEAMIPYHFKGIRNVVLENTYAEFTGGGITTGWKFDACKNIKLINPNVVNLINSITIVDSQDISIDGVNYGPSNPLDPSDAFSITNSYGIKINGLVFQNSYYSKAFNSCEPTIESAFTTVTKSLGAEQAVYIPTNVIENLFINGSFEGGEYGWTVSSGTGTRETSTQLKGNHLKVVSTNGGNSGVIQYITISAAMVGRPLTLSFLAMGETLSEGVIYPWFSGAGITLHTDHYMLIMDGKWKAGSATVIPLEAGTLQVGIGSYVAPNAVKTYYIDAATLVEGCKGMLMNQTINQEAILAAAAPTSGTWTLGDRVWTSSPASGGAPGWVCTNATGTGTWTAMAILQ